jgi:hypothetical protein
VINEGLHIKSPFLCLISEGLLIQLLGCDDFVSWVYYGGGIDSKINAFSLSFNLTMSHIHSSRPVVEGIQIVY